jgi:hypothetical protein
MVPCIGSWLLKGENNMIFQTFEYSTMLDYENVKYFLKIISLQPIDFKSMT